MAAPLPLRSDFDAAALRREARGSRGDAARVGGVTLQIIRGWVVRFNAEGPPGLIDRKVPGATPKLDRTNGIARARTEIGLANLACNLRRCLFLESHAARA